jgi:uncharacterized membrane protein YccC
VLVLHDGYDWRRTVQRGLERFAGTWLGLLLAAAVLALRPQGWWLVATIMLLQFMIEMLVVRSYALAVVAITAMALLIASGGNPVSDVGALLLARGVDTTVGCLLGIAVYAFVKPRAATARVRDELIATLGATQAVVAHLKAGTVTSVDARVARRALQHRVFVLAETFEAGVGGTAHERAEAEQIWPDVAATQRLAYEALSICWKQEHGEAQPPVESEALEGEWRHLRARILPEQPQKAG